MCRNLTNVAIQLLCLSACDSGAFDSHADRGPTKLAFTLQPTSAIAGAAMSPVAVTVQDAYGNTIANASTSITVAIGTNAASGTLSGTTTVAAVNGAAIFSNLLLDKSGTGYTLAADATGLIGATSSPFNVMEAVAAVTVTPGHSSVDAGTQLNLTATILDAAGNVLSGRTITWNTSDWRIVYQLGNPVGATDVVCGLAPGKATIKATSEGKSGIAVVTVTGGSSVGCCYAGC